MITKTTIATVLVVGLPSPALDLQGSFSETTTTSLFALLMLCLIAAIKLQSFSERPRR